MLALLVLVAVLSTAFCSIANRINHKGKDIFLNGINVAWGIAPAFCADVNYLDPTCSSYDCTKDSAYFEQMFAEIQQNGGNSVRWWLHGDGNAVPVINSNYSDRIVDSITSTQINSIKLVLELGSKYGILVNLCIWSFDMVNDNGYGPAYGLWNKIVTDDTHKDSYINNWLKPLVSSVKDHNNLLSFEVFNEPEGMIDKWGWTNCQAGSIDCAKVSISQAQRFANHMVE